MFITFLVCVIACIKQILEFTINIIKDDITNTVWSRG